MVETVRDLRQAGISPPIMVGGAALSNRFTRLRIGPDYDGLVTYAQDAMTGLALANTLRDSDELQKLSSQIEAETDELLQAEQQRQTSTDENSNPVSPAQINHDSPVPQPPDLRIHVVKDYDLDKIFSFINPQMLYVRHLGYQGRFEDALENGDPSAVELRESVRKVEDLLLANPNITASAVFKFFPCNSDNQNLVIYDTDGTTEL